jgi:hypothetical protein
VNVCTIITRNHLPRARVLATSVAAHHPAARLAALVVDGEFAPLGAASESFEILRPCDLELELDEFRRMSVIYDAFELANALKPWLLLHLLRRGEEAVVYLDSDIEVFHPITDLGDLAVAHGILLTPHTTRAIPRDRRSPEEKDILQTGMYNGGCIVVGAKATEFLDWWGERLRRDCLDERERGLFVDQRWLDFVPSLFDHHLLRDRGCNVAFWNLNQGDLSWNGNGYEVNGRMLRFFHFSGFDPGVPEQVWSRSGTRHPLRVDLREEPALRTLYGHYAERLLEEGHGEWIGVQYGFGRTAGGLVLDRRMRRLYRRALLAADWEGGPVPPDPFDPGRAEAFLAWLRSPGPRPIGVSRYLQALYDERFDLQISFPRLDAPAEVERYLAWVQIDGARAEPPVPALLVDGRD